MKLGPEHRSEIGFDRSIPATWPHPVISPQTAVALERYRGEWVAVIGWSTDHPEVFTGASIQEAIGRCRDAGLDDPLVWRVPRHPEITRY